MQVQDKTCAILRITLYKKEDFKSLVVPFFLDKKKWLTNATWDPKDILKKFLAEDKAFWGGRACDGSNIAVMTILYLLFLIDNISFLLWKVGHEHKK